MKLKEVIGNVTKNKITTGTGIAVLIILGLNIAGVNLPKKVGIPVDQFVLYLGTAIQSVLLIFTKDPARK